MPSRGRYLRRRFSTRSLRRRRRLRRLENAVYYAGAVLLMVLSVMAVYGFFSDRAKGVDVSAEDVAAFRIPHDSFMELMALAGEYGVDFAQAVTLYSVENGFFPSKTGAGADAVREFMRDYADIREGYRDRDIEPYGSLLSTVLGEIKCFPVPQGYEAGYMYGDSWNAKTGRYVDIIDRENIRGRIAVVSMSAGVVEELGLAEKTGYRIVIKTAQNTRYIYTHLDGYADGLDTGVSVQPGMLLGHMGAVGSAPVRLRLQIAPYFSLSPKEFYINPYPFLRLAEDYATP